MKKRLFLFFVFASASFGQLPNIPTPPDADTAIAGTTNFVGSITTGITDLVSTVSPSMMSFAWWFLSFAGVYALLESNRQIALRQLAVPHFFNPLIATVAYISILFRICVAATMLTFYATPIPGMSLNLHQLFPYLGQALANVVTTDLVKQVIEQFNIISNNLPDVGVLQILPSIIEVVIEVLIALAELGLNLFAVLPQIVIGVLSCVGPLMIPFYVLPRWQRLFWNWIDNLFSYSMYSFVNACIVFIFSHVYLDLFTNVFSFSIAQWFVTLPLMTLITGALLYTVFQVPKLTHMLFGGAGAIVEGFANSVQSSVVRGVAAGLL